MLPNFIFLPGKPPIVVGSTLGAGFGALHGSTAAPFRLPVSNGHELRQLQPSDAGELFQLADAHRRYLRQWLPWLDSTRTPADTLAFIESTLRRAADQAGFQFAIVVDERIAGVIGHHPIHRENRSASLGYWLAEAQQGKGLMTASCRAIIAHAFETLDLNRVEIRCATGNRRSRAVPERLGFTLEGTLRDTEWLYDHFVDLNVYGLLRREWVGNGTPLG